MTGSSFLWTLCPRQRLKKFLIESRRRSVFEFGHRQFMTVFVDAIA